MPDNVERDIGALLARVTNMEIAMRELAAELREQRQIMDRASGGWKAVAIVAGFGATVGGIIVKIMPYLVSVVDKR